MKPLVGHATAIRSLSNPFFGALLAEGTENQGNAVSARGLLSAGLAGALALVLAVWKPCLRDKVIALGFGALVVGTVLYPAVGVYIGGAGLGIHMTAGAAFILVIAGLWAHPGATKNPKKKSQEKAPTVALG